MPNLVNWYQIAHDAGQHYVFVDPEQCLPVSYMRSNCNQCVRVCPVHAISFQGHTNHLHFNRDACISCGSCCSLCPTEALRSVQPSSVAILRRLLQTVEFNQGTAVIACARAAHLHQIDNRHFAFVPCLARVEEAHLLQAVSAGATQVLLVDGMCKTCKYGSCDKHISYITSEANKLLELVESKVVAARLSEFPQDFKRKADEDRGQRRRNDFAESLETGKQLLGRAAKVFAKQKAKNNSTTTTLIESLGLDLDEKDPPLFDRQQKLIDALYFLAEKSGVLERCFGEQKDQGNTQFPAGNEQPSAGNTRLPAGNEQPSAGNTRLSVEQARQSANNSQPEQEKAQLPAEKAQQEQEKVQLSAEKAQQEQEKAQLPAEKARQEQEKAQLPAEKARQSANNSQPAEAYNPEITSRCFGRVIIRTGQCRKCGMCARLCKRKALRISEDDAGNKAHFALDFTPSLCSRCCLCEDVCYERAICVVSNISLRDLFSFEPMHIVVK